MIIFSTSVLILIYKLGAGHGVCWIKQLGDHLYLCMANFIGMVRVGTRLCGLGNGWAVRKRNKHYRQLSQETRLWREREAEDVKKGVGWRGIFFFSFIFSIFTWTRLLTGWTSLVAQTVKHLPTMQETPGSIFGLGRSSGEGNGNPF